jgi:hypothetical protein
MKLIVAALLLILPQAGGPFAESTFLISPYLFLIEGSRIGVAWQYLDSQSPLENQPVRFFSDQGVETAVPTVEDHGIHFAVLPIGHCGFGSKAAYQVAGQRAPRVIDEIPCAQRGSRARFSFIADTQGGPERVNTNQILDFPGSLVIYGGDLVEHGSVFLEWIQFFGSLTPLNRQRVMVPVVGNHEYRSDNAVPYWKRFFRTRAEEAFYSINIGPAQIIVLNSNFEDDPSLIHRQLRWLEHELQTKSPWKIVTFHHPAYSVGLATNPLSARKEHIQLRKYYLPLFEAYKVDLVLNGHTHLFERAYKDGVNYIIAGPGGGKLGPRGAKNPFSIKHSFRKRTVTHIEATETRLRALTLDRDGEKLDELILRK